MDDEADRPFARLSGTGGDLGRALIDLALGNQLAVWPEHLNGGADPEFPGDAPDPNRQERLPALDQCRGGTPVDGDPPFSRLPG